MSVIVNSVVSLSAMGFLFAAGLAIASKKFAVEVDPRQEAILNVLPGANCGGCGFPGCGGLATAIVEGKAPVNGCPVGGAPVAQKVADIMGVAAQEGVRMVANVHCNGTIDHAVEKAEYFGILDCKAAVIAQSGQKGCTYGCMGFGTCVRACKFDAIYIGTDGVAHVDRDKCVACGKCIEVCPKSIIEWIPYNQQVYIYCKSREKGKDVKDKCSVGCIGCQMCVKVCPFDAITFENNLPTIHYEKCKQCNKCVEKCPTKTIVGRQIKKKVQPVVAKPTEGVENVEDAKPEMVKVNVPKTENEGSNVETVKTSEDKEVKTAENVNEVSSETQNNAENQETRV